jgi:hypothetical protein
MADRLRRVAPIAAVIVLALAAAIYLSAGTLTAYLAADDFQWIRDGHTFTWAHLVTQISGERFYRPMIDVWFGATVRICGAEPSCYHAANLLMHLLNIGLLFALLFAATTNVWLATCSAAFFAVEPAYTQAVLWVSGITGVLMTSGVLLSLWMQALSWKSRSGRRGYELTAVLFFWMGLFAHEAAIVVPLLSWLLWTTFGKNSLFRRPVLVVGLGAGILAFVVATVLANHNNTVFTESRYAAGLHAFRHALDYIVALYVGPGWWLAYTLSLAAIGVFIAASPVTRFGALWLLVAMMPYLGFTAGNVSRYLYLPAIGFAVALAGAVTGSAAWLSARYPARRGVIAGGSALVALFIVGRFARFDLASIRSQVQWMEPWREFAGSVARDKSSGSAIRVKTPPSNVVDPIYFEPIARWVLQDYESALVMDR